MTAARKKYHVLSAEAALRDWGLLVGPSMPLHFLRGGWKLAKWQSQREPVERLQLLRLFSLVRSRLETLQLALQQDLARQMRDIRLDLMGDYLEGMR